MKRRAWTEPGLWRDVIDVRRSKVAPIDVLELVVPLPAKVGLEAVATHGEVVAIDLVIRRAVVRVDRLLPLVVAHDEVLADVAEARHHRRAGRRAVPREAAGRADGRLGRVADHPVVGDVRDAVPRVPGA